MSFTRIAGLALLAGLSAGTAQAADPWVIGMIAPTTGPLTTVGLRQLSAVQWWEQDVNAKGGIRGRQVQIIHCNDEGSPEKAVTCARDLIDKKSLLILNSSVTGPIRATMQLVTQGPVMITPSPNVMPEASTFVFQTSPSDLMLTQAIADYLKENHADSLAIIAATDASGEVGVASAAAIFPKAGIKYDLARIDLRANDASVQLANVAKEGVPLIYSNYSGGGAAAVIKSFSNLGLTQPLLISYANISDSFISVIKDDMPPRLLGTGLTAVAPDLITDPDERKRIDYFVTSYEAWKKEKMDNLSLQGLGLADTAAAILTQVDDPSNAVAVRDFLEKTPIKSMATFHYSHESHIGLGAKDISILEYKNGRWVKAAPLK
jgi:branched-chain amino acid transport system substrate-binding protein